MEKMRFYINGLGRFISFKGKVTRTPCTIDIFNSKDLDFLKKYLDSFCINYEIKPIKKPEQIKNENEVKQKETSKNTKEKPKSNKPLTILEKLTTDEKIEGLTK